MSDRLPTTLPLSILADAGRLDVVPVDSVWCWCGLEAVWAGDVLDAIYELGTQSHERPDVADGYTLNPSTPMGRAAIACIIASLCGVEPMGASVSAGHSPEYGSTVRLDTMAVVKKEWVAPEWLDGPIARFFGSGHCAVVPGLSGLSGSPSDCDRALVAVVMHLVQP
jgi:hypothetical protein